MSWNYRKGPGPGSGARGARSFVRPADDPPGTSRLFIAVPVADDVRTAVGALMEEVAGAPIDQRAFGQPRWVGLEGLHLTLRFLGATPDERQADVASAVAAGTAGVGDFQIVLSGGGSFPDAFRPRVLWLGIIEGSSELTDLARRLGAALAPLGWPLDDRPFTPHLTLARTDGVPGADERARRLVDMAGDKRLPWQADRVVLYKSLVGHGPTHYEILATSKLTGS
jgi:RNA 2',3'-cyclic 3'-phosphodiesterase